MKAPSSKKSLKRKFGHAFYSQKRRVLSLQDSPQRIAWGVAIGTFVAYLPIVGVQMVIGSFVCWICRANVLASIPMAWITNPVTIVPIYFLLFLLGGIFTGDSMTYDEMKQLLSQIGDSGLFTWTGIIPTGINWEGAKLIFNLIGSIFWPTFIGGSIVGFINGFIFYFLTIKLVTRFQARRQNTRDAWRKKSSEHLAVQSVEPSIDQDGQQPDPEQVEQTESTDGESST